MFPKAKIRKGHIPRKGKETTIWVVYGRYILEFNSKNVYWTPTLHPRLHDTFDFLLTVAHVSY